MQGVSHVAPDIKCTSCFATQTFAVQIWGSCVANANTPPALVE